jgi:hypothetical protein
MPYLLSVSRTDFSKRKANWANPDYRSRTRVFYTPELSLPYFGVVLVVGDDGRIEDSLPLWGPKGMLYAGDRLLVACYSEIRAFDRDLTGSSQLISEPWCNDLHSLRPSERGVLVAVSGLDAAFEVGLDGSVVWEWWAADSGLATTKQGDPWALGKDKDHRLFSYPIEDQSTHINAIAALDESTLVATLLHQNMLIAIDRETGEWSTLFENLGRPHAVRTVADHTITFADTLAGTGVVARVEDGRAEVLERVTVDTSWIHDAYLDDDRWLFVDGANCRVIHTDRSGDVVHVDQFDPDWCLYEVLPFRT